MGKLKAYSLFDPYSNESEIVFSQLSTDELQQQQDKDECKLVRRLQGFDKYAHLGYVPPEALLSAKWWIYCWECEKKIEKEIGGYYSFDEDEEEIPLSPVFTKSKAYCSEGCRRKRLAAIEKRDNDERLARVKITKTYPESVIKSLWANSDSQVYADILLPSLAYKIGWHWTVGTEKVDIYVNNCDLAKWNALYAEK